ncbi:hypothetical protein NDU88_007719 [Pleurodeles waltl]|uniref:Uncharacterized protein n=1 Tax=Pleurodeles waltl TaxID=8319 RepID=A0AAV7U2C8_PLEWA|nr:hypothetical protein NDU88_007719 [Pleurodeles waltl]
MASRRRPTAAISSRMCSVAVSNRALVAEAAEPEAAGVVGNQKEPINSVRGILFHRLVLLRPPSQRRWRQQQKPVFRIPCTPHLVVSLCSSDIMNEDATSFLQGLRYRWSIHCVHQWEQAPYPPCDTNRSHRPKRTLVEPGALHVDISLDSKAVRKERAREAAEMAREREMKGNMI